MKIDSTINALISAIKTCGIKAYFKDGYIVCDGKAIVRLSKINKGVYKVSIIPSYIDSHIKLVSKLVLLSKNSMEDLIYIDIRGKDIFGYALFCQSYIKRLAMCRSTSWKSSIAVLDKVRRMLFAINACPLPNGMTSYDYFIDCCNEDILYKTIIQSRAWFVDGEYRFIDGTVLYDKDILIMQDFINRQMVNRKKKSFKNIYATKEYKVKVSHVVIGGLRYGFNSFRHIHASR